MIVRDEERVVAGTPACAAPHVDTWVVVDTGPDTDSDLQHDDVPLA